MTRRRPTTQQKAQRPSRRSSQRVIEESESALVSVVSEDQIDESLKESFSASDPPSRTVLVRIEAAVGRQSN
jgi:hypothetical protein